MSIEHKDISDDQLHEPKGVVSASNKEVYIANGSGSGAWERITEKHIDRATSTDNVFGWNDISDNLYSSGSPRAIASSVRTKVTNNGAASQSNTTRLGGIWSTATNSFAIDDLNSVYLLRIGSKIKAVAAAGTPYTVKFELESDNGPLVFLQHDAYIKGGGYENAITFTDMMYIGSSINASNISIYVTADTNITMYDVGFVIQRIYTEKNF